MVGSMYVSKRKCDNGQKATKILQNQKTPLKLQNERYTHRLYFHVYRHYEFQKNNGMHRSSEKLMLVENFT